MSHFQPSGMIIQGVVTNISKKNPTEARKKPWLKVLMFKMNPGLSKDSVDDYDQNFYHLVDAEDGSSQKIIMFNEKVDGIDVTGKNVRGKPRTLGTMGLGLKYLIIDTYDYNQRINFDPTLIAGIDMIRHSVVGKRSTQTHQAGPDA